VTDARFPGTARLRNAPEFRQVLSNGRRRHDDFFTVVVLANELQRPRLGITVSRRAARLAVQRNRIKRLIRESYRQQIETLPAVDIVVMAKSQARDADNRTLIQSLESHWHRLR